MDTYTHTGSCNTTDVGNHLLINKSLHYAFTEAKVGGDRTTIITTGTAKDQCHDDQSHLVVVCACAIIQAVDVVLT
jgi:hypothetical protein